MTTQQLDRLCTEALQRVQYYINRAAGQHLRAMKKDRQPASTQTTQPTQQPLKGTP